MGIYTGNNNANVIDLRGTSLGPNETGNSVSLLGGNDTFYGSTYTDIVTGGDGDDLVYGLGGNDILIGGNGADRIYGGMGNDNLTGGAGNDTIWGDAGNDVMYGGIGNDVYAHAANTGVDIINDDMNEAGGSGYGGGSDSVYMGFNLADIQYYRPSGTSNLCVGTAADIADGVLDDGVVIENFYGSPNNRIEYLLTADNYQVDLGFIV